MPRRGTLEQERRKLRWHVLAKGTTKHFDPEMVGKWQPIYEERNKTDAVRKARAFGERLGAATVVIHANREKIPPGSVFGQPPMGSRYVTASAPTYRLERAVDGSGWTVHVGPGQFSVGTTVVPYAFALGMITRKGAIKVWTPAARNPRGYVTAARKELRRLAGELRKEGKIR